MSYLTVGGGGGGGGGTFNQQNNFQINQSNTVTNMYIKIGVRGEKKAAKKLSKLQWMMKQFYKEWAFMMARGTQSILAGFASLMTKALVAPFTAGIAAARQFFGLLDSSMKLSRTRMLTVARLDTLTKGMGEARMRNLEQFVLGEEEGQTRFTSHAMNKVSEWATTLLASGVEWNKSKEWIGRLNDIFGADTDAMGRMVYNIGQIKAADRAYGLDIRQFGTAGFPIKKYLAEYLGIAEKEVNDAVSKGLVDYKAVEQAIFKATGRGGRYEGGTLKKLETTPGRLGQLQARMQVMLTDVGTPIWESLFDAVVFANDVLKSLRPEFQELGEAIADFVLRMTNAITGTGQTGKGGISWLAKQIKKFGNTAELMFYSIFGLPERLKKQGFTQDNIAEKIDSDFEDIGGKLFEWWKGFLKKIELPLIELFGRIALKVGGELAKGFWNYIWGIDDTNTAENKSQEELKRENVPGYMPFGDPMVGGIPLSAYQNSDRAKHTPSAPENFEVFKSKVRDRMKVDSTGLQLFQEYKNKTIRPSSPTLDNKTSQVINNFDIYTDDTKDAVKTQVASAIQEFKQMELVV